MAKSTLFQKLIKTGGEKEKDKSGSLQFSVIFKIFIFIATLLACTFFFYYHLRQQDEVQALGNMKTGFIWPGRSLIAEFSFPVYKDDAQLKSEQEQAGKEALQVFTIDREAENISNRSLADYIYNLNASVMEANNFISDKIHSDQLNSFYELDSAARVRSIKNIEKVVKNYIRGIYRNGFVNKSKDFIVHDVIAVRFDKFTEKLYPKFSLIDSSDIDENIKTFISNKVKPEAFGLAVNLTRKIILPNIKYSKELTDKEKELAKSSVAKTDGIVRKDEKIIDKGETVTEEIFRKIKSYERSRLLASDVDYSIWMFIGSFGHAALIYTILILYLFLIRRKIFRDNYQIIVLSLVLVLVSLTSWLSIEIESNLPLEYFVLIPGMAMLVAIVFDSRTAFYVTVTMSLMIAGIRGNDYDTGTTMMFAGTLAAYTVRDIKSRTQIFQSIFFIFVGLAIPIGAFGLERSSDMMLTVYKLAVALINSAISPLITFGFLFILEKFSNVTTDLKLQEYTNLSHPLMIKMSENAPGTYQHTLSLAMLAEKCAVAIGANELLAKAGAYFHDIGKMAKAEYFVENQIEIDNKHDLLTPKKSTEVIRKHVIDGVELAKKYKLPQRLIDFIPMHHGTSLIKYFYAKAIEEAENEDVNEQDFRYPGPKPNSKETAIVMICDSAEAVSRLSSKSKEKLEAVIDGIIQDKLLDGQFDECNLTFGDLQKIKETCIKNLLGISHPRVEYKKIPEKK